MKFETGLYLDQDKNKTRWAVLDCKTYTWYFAKRYGKLAATKLAAKLNKES